MRLTGQETALVRRAIEGDANSFGTLYELHLAGIHRYIFYRVNHVQDAEDLTETVFLKAWQAIGSYRLNGTPFRAWLYRIAHNVVVDHYRTARILDPLPPNPQVPDEKLNLEGDLAAREEVDLVSKAIMQLSPLHQHVVILRFIEGLSYADVGVVLEKSNGAVRVLQHRALKELQALLAAVETKDG